MRVLVIETATAACSAALIDEGVVVAEAHEVVGRGHAERLLPLIAALPGGGRAEAIWVDVGPGSFTGIRVGLAAARGLALGWGVPVSGFQSTAVLAAAALAQNGAPAALAAVLEGGHGEVFMQSFAADPFRATGPMASLTPQAALAALNGLGAVGGGVKYLAALDPALPSSEALPRAADARLLPASFKALPPSPRYGRPPDAVPARP